MILGFQERQERPPRIHRGPVAGERRISGAIESRHGQSSNVGVASGANLQGASGPAQFLAGTWQRFGVDGDADGDLDPHDPADAIAAMASYLRASGAPEDWRGALRTYNRSDAYVRAVERLAARYRRAAG